jgi:hypothetical protein
MNKLVKLGNEIKQRYPQYRDEDSEAVGLAIIRQVGTAYPDYETDALIDAVLSRVSANRGMFFSWLERMRSESRMSTNSQWIAESQSLRAVEAERHALDLQREAEWDGVLARKRGREEAEVSHELNIEARRRDNQIANKAAKKGLSSDNYQTAKMYKKAAKIETQKTQKEAEIETRKTKKAAEIDIGKLKKAAEIEVEKEEKILAVKYKDHEKRESLDLKKKEELALLQLNTEKQLALDEIRANFILKHFTEHQKIAMLQTQLDQLYEEIEELEKSKSRGWQRKIEDRQRTIEALKENQDGLRKGLLEADKPKALEGTRKTPKRKRDPRQRVEKPED